MKSKTIIENEFTGYRAEIAHKGDTPAVSTVKKHLRQSKASECQSCTTIETNGIQMVIVNRGHGDELLHA